MATLVLGVAGGFLGGPLGALLGAGIGRNIDRRLFGPKLPQGEPVNDGIGLQDSNYGRPIPLIYGRARVAGHVIWASELVEERSNSRRRSGKGGAPKSGNGRVSYSVSFAVALSSRQILRVERIWADGKLLRDANGDLLVPVTIRTHLGDETQQADPLIEAHEGAGEVPDMRGLAMVVFEDLPLGEFANRIPNLTFEVVADEPATLDRLLIDIATRAGVPATASPGLTQAFAGLAITHQADASRILDVIDGTFGFILAERNGTLAFTAIDEGGIFSPDTDEWGARAERASPVPRLNREREDGQRLPQGIDLRYLDAGRDFQPGLQRARRQQSVARRIETFDSPFALDAACARRLADWQLVRRWQRQTRLSASLPLAAIAIETGDRILLPTDLGGGEMLVESLRLEDGRLVLEGFPFEASALPTVDPPPASEPFLPIVLAPPGLTRVHFLDFPGLVTEGADLSLPVAMAGVSSAWRGGVLLASRDDGESFETVAHADLPAIIGDVLEPPGEGPVGFWDEGSQIRVRLLRSEATLESRSQLAVLNGANLAKIGDEMIRFREATLQTDGSYLLRGLLRGCHGTEHAMTGHQAGEDFVLVDGGGLIDVLLAADLIGRPIPFKAVSVHDNPLAVTDTTAVFAANALKPLSPVHAQARRLSNGDIEMVWTRRTRLSGGWLDHADVPLGEESEAYELDILDTTGITVLRTLTTQTPRAIYPLADQQSDFGTAPASLTMAIHQISSRVGRGYPWRGTLTL